MDPSSAVARAVLQSATLSVWQVKRMVDLRDVVALLHQAGVQFVLAGAHSIAPWTRKPRATTDVDLVVAPRSHRKAVRALRSALPDLVVRDLEVVTRFLDPETGESKIDLMKPRDELLRTVFENSIAIDLEGVPARIPDVEMAAAMKFAAMVGRHRRRADRMQDGSDFTRIVVASPDLDLQRLADLGELVYRGGGKEIMDVVAAIREDRPLSF